MRTGSRKLAVWFVLAAVLLLGAVALAGYGINVAVSQQRETNRLVCRAVNQFNAVIASQLQRSALTLPKLAYFRAHPDELAQQEIEIRRQLNLFRQRQC